MPQIEPLPAPTLAEVEDALDIALAALIAHRDRPRAGDGAIEAVSAAAIMSTDITVLEHREYVDDPIGMGLKHAIRQLGYALHHAVGGDTEAMLDATERVAMRDPRTEGHRLSIANAAFDGIGSWAA